MTLRDRDKKLLMGIVPVILIVAYWMLFLSPKRDEASKAGKDLSAAQQKRDEAVSQAGQLTQAKANYASDYETVVRLGKAIPATVDMPSLIVQLDRAARGTGIDFTKIKVGDRQSASAAGGSTPAPASGGSPAGGNASSGASAGSSAPAAAPGGQQAQSAPGQTVEKAGNAASAASGSSNAAAGTSADTNTQTSQNVSGGKGLPVGGGDTSSASTGASGGSGAPGLDSIPLEFEFNGSFLDLADFFHRMKRFVRVVNDRIIVRGRLMTIDTVTFKSDESFPVLKAEFRATVYLTPKEEGATAGATPEGPAQGTPASGGSTTPAPSTPPAGQSAAGSAPTATAVTR
jgi:Tfp pilus assembly protein PilO